MGNKPSGLTWCTHTRIHTNAYTHTHTYIHLNARHPKNKATSNRKTNEPSEKIHWIIDVIYAVLAIVRGHTQSPRYPHQTLALALPRPDIGIKRSAIRHSQCSRFCFDFFFLFSVFFFIENIPFYQPTFRIPAWFDLIWSDLIWVNNIFEMPELLPWK